MTFHRLQRTLVAACLVALPFVWAPPARGQQGHSQIRDVAGLFSLEAVREARTQLDRIERETKVPVLIETLDSAGGEPIHELSLRRARQSGVDGVYVLILKKEHGIEVRDYRSILGKERDDRIKQAISKPFKEERYDEGLAAGVEAIASALRTSRLERGSEDRPSSDRTAAATPSREEAAPPPATRKEDRGDDAGLVLRNQVRLTLAGATRIITESQAKARSMNLKMNIAVVDDGGHLLAFARMDGARPASGYTAMTKATAAATFRQPTGPIRSGDNPPDVLLNLSLQNAATASGGKVTTLPGGVPIVVDGQIIGAVGVGGGTGEQDAEVARAGIAALMDQLGGNGKADAK